MVSMSGLLFEVREIYLSNNLRWGRTRDDIVHIYQQDSWLVKIGERLAALCPLHRSTSAMKRA